MTIGLAIVATGVFVQISACTSVQQRGAASASAFVDCQAPNLAAALVDLIPIAKEALMGAISGDGHVDTGKLKADMGGMKSDLGKCALAAAVAALATPVEQTPGAPAAAPLEVDGRQLRAAFSMQARELGWAPVHVGKEVL